VSARKMKSFAIINLNSFAFSRILARKMKSNGQTLYDQLLARPCMVCVGSHLPEIEKEIMWKIILFLNNYKILYRSIYRPTSSYKTILELSITCIQQYLIK
jgi:hypothetical protein